MTLCGILAGLAFASRIADPAVAWPIFLFLTALHVFANYKGAWPQDSTIICIAWA